MAATMHCPRFFLNVYGSCWGSICGDFMYRTKDYAQSGNLSALQTIPKADTILSITSDAKYVLIVETDATAQSLVLNGLQRREKCIIIASRGFPDGNTRQMVKLLWNDLQVRLFLILFFLSVS
jgi:DNA topoisomerase VI subunit A